MACEPIGSFEATPLDISGFDAYTAIDKQNEEHRKIVRHLYRRMGYGAGLEDLDFAHGKSINYIVDTLVGDANDLGFPTDFNWTDRPISITKRVEGQFNLVPETINGLLANYWINESIVDIRNSIRAKLMLFWHSHFAVEEKVYERNYAVLRYYKLLFNNAFGNFKEFVKAMGLTPIMISYLNGHENHGNPLGPDPADGGGNPYPNENYAREVLELFTMGIKYQGNENYTRDDINMLARSLSGWRVGNYGASKPPPSEANGEVRFHYNRHDWMTKNLFDVEYGGYATAPGTNLNIPAGTSLADNPVGWDKVFVPSGSSQRELFKPFESGDGSTQPYGIKNIVAIPYEKDSSDNYSNMPVLPNSSDSTYQEIAERKIVTAAWDEYNFAHDVIFEQRQRAIAYFICKKLYNFYVYADTDRPNFEDTAGLDTYLEKLADIFIYGLDSFNATTLAPTTDLSLVTPKWNIKDVLNVIFKSQHFYDAGVIGTQIKSPVACAASFFRAGNLQPGNGNDGDDGGDPYHYKYRMALLNDQVYPAVGSNHSNYYPIAPYYNHVTGEGINPATVKSSRTAYDTSTTIMIRSMCGTLGQRLLNPPDVAGWPGHHNWLNEFTLVKRWEMISNYILGGYGNFQIGLVNKAMEKFWDIFTDTDFTDPVVPAYITADPILVTEEVSAITFILKVSRYFFAVDPTARQIKDALSVFLENNQYSFSYIINMPMEGQNRLRELLLHFIRQPEFQLA